MAKAKKEPEGGDVTGRALVDIPRIGAHCGEYITVPADVAAELETSGQFDPNAVAPKE